MPTTPADIVDRTLAEIDRQSDEVRRMAARSADQLLWRPEPERWSMAEHLDHLSLTNDAYLAPLEACVVLAEKRGHRGDGPYRRSWLAHQFVSKLGPPVTLRVKTLKRLVPPSDLNPTEVVERFLGCQTRFATVAERARGLDVGRARFRSPLFALLKMDAAVGFDLILTHNRRHFWLCDRIPEQPGFPDG